MRGRGGIGLGAIGMGGVIALPANCLLSSLLLALSEADRESLDIMRCKRPELFFGSGERIG